MTAKTLEQRMDALEAELAGIKAQLAARASGRVVDLPRVNIDDPRFGDPLVRKDPPRWDGPSFVGSPFSRCSAAFLRELSGFLQWRAGKERAEPGKGKYATYSMLDAARAIAWAERIEAGGARAAASSVGAPEPEPDRWGGSGPDEEIPFIRNEAAGPVWWRP